MKYSITNETTSSCTITLLPENKIEKQLLKSIDEQDTFMFHYSDALKQHVHPKAEFLELIEYSQFPSPVTVKYQIVKGIGE